MNLYDFKIPKTDENFTTLLEYKNIKIKRIVSSDNIDKKVYAQDEDEWIVVIDGNATLKIANELKTLKKGDMLFIPSHTPHEVLSATSGTLWLTIHIF